MASIAVIASPSMLKKPKAALRIVNALRERDFAARTPSSHSSPWPFPSLTTLSNWSQAMSQGNTTVLHAAVTISQSTKTQRHTTAGMTPALRTGPKFVMP
jgi:hypothetical protein